jgi:hypothetical protein
MTTPEENQAMTNQSEHFKKAPRKKTPPAKRVTLSAEARKAYEEMMQSRDERDRSYGQFLPADGKTR